MKHKDEKTPEQKAELESLDTTPRPIAPVHNKAGADKETLSHNWQPGSPAVDTNILNEHGLTSASIMDKIDSPENLKARKDAAENAATFAIDDSIDPSKRDVSDALYAQPGSDAHKAYLKRVK